MVTLTDDQAEKVLLAGLELAIVVRDEGPNEVLTAARNVLAAADGDPIAALVTLAAAIRPELKLDRWWDREPCGTRSAAARHRRHGQQLDQLCLIAERAYNAGAHARARQQRTATAA